MATSSILENIRINNPEFIEQYVEAMDASTGASEFVRRSGAEIVLADAEQSKKLSELRKLKRMKKE